MKTSTGSKKAWEVRRQRYGKSGVSADGLAKLRETQRKTRLGKPLEEEVKSKISSAQKGKPRPYACKPCSPEKKLKISLAQKGKPRLYLRGRKRPPFSDEWRRRISEGKKGVVVDRTAHDEAIMEKMKNLAEEGFRVVPAGLWKFPVPDLIAIRHGKVKAVEIDNKNTGRSIEQRYKRRDAKLYFDEVEAIPLT